MRLYGTLHRTSIFSLALGFTLTLMAQDSVKPKHNVIIFVADGLRRGSVNATDAPTLAAIRAQGVDFQNSHSSFPTFTTANASVIATGHGLGDTGDYSNVIWPGVWLAKPDSAAATGVITPFLENDEVLANMNTAFAGNYLGERTLLSMAREKGFNVASVGKLGPTAIQQADALSWDQLGLLSANGTIVVDDTTGQASGFPLPESLRGTLLKAGVPAEAPMRSNGYGAFSQSNNGFSGDAQTAGTLQANRVQGQWFADVTTKALLPTFTADNKPFVLLFWSRDPDGTQHNQGDSLQTLEPGINGETSRSGVQNADHALAQIVAWLDAHPAVRATTDIFVTSDHGFATVSRREVAPDHTQTAEVSSALDYAPSGHEKPQPKGTLPSGFLAVDLAIRQHMRVFDPAVRSTAGPSPYAEVLVGGEVSHHPTTGSALLGENVLHLDGSDAKLIVAANGGSDLIYVPSKDGKLVHETLSALAELDYVGGIFIDDAYCATAKDCPGALPLSSISLIGKSKLPRPAIVVTYKVFYSRPGDLQSAAQVSDTTLQEGQGMHGGFGREQTLNNMAAIGPDFKTSSIDQLPVGNMDIVPTLAHILGITMPATGSLTGRVIEESLASSVEKTHTVSKEKELVSTPTRNGQRTKLRYQELDGRRYYDEACFIKNVERPCR